MDNKNLKIGLILNPYGEKHVTGLGRVAFKLSKVLIKNNPQHSFTVFLKGYKSHTPNFDGNNWSLIRLKHGRFIFDFQLRKFFGDIDAFIFFTPVIPLFSCPPKSIVIVHDLSYKYFFSKNLKSFFKKVFIHFVHNISFKKAKRIVTVSNYTRNEVYRYFNIAKKKIVTIYNGYDDINFSEVDIVKEAHKPYFLSIGTIKKRKNQLNIVKAFLEFKEHDSMNFNLIVIGKNGGEYYKKILEIVEKSVFKQDVVFLGPVSNAKRSFLYKNATALIYPSLLEGFGLPILEAMGCGLPVVTSNVGALKEVASNSALLVDPYNISSIADAMKILSIDTNKRKELIAKGLEHSKQFSWRKTANKIINLIENINEKSDK